MKKEVAEQLAFRHKYDIVKYYGLWNGYHIFIAENTSYKEYPRIGYPTFIVVNNGEARFASPSETLAIMDIRFIERKNYQGEAL